MELASLDQPPKNLANATTLVPKLTTVLGHMDSASLMTAGARMTEISVVNTDLLKTVTSFMDPGMPQVKYGAVMTSIDAMASSLPMDHMVTPQQHSSLTWSAAGAPHPLNTLSYQPAQLAAVAQHQLQLQVPFQV